MVDLMKKAIVFHSSSINTGQVSFYPHAIVTEKNRQKWEYESDYRYG